MAKKPNPKPYTSTQDVYVGGKYHKAGHVFVTDEEPADHWTEHKPAEAQAIDQAVKDIPVQPPLENLDKAALQALAVDRHINVDGMSKQQMIDAIKSWNDPTL